MTDPELEEALRRAAKKGAKKALEEVGLDSERAIRDIRDLHNLLDAWRDVKRTILRTVVRWATITVLTALVLGAGIKWQLFGD